MFPIDQEIQNQKETKAHVNHFELESHSVVDDEECGVACKQSSPLRLDFGSEKWTFCKFKIDASMHRGYLCLPFDPHS